MSDFIIAQIRTYVPMAVGAALAWLLQFGLDLYEVEAQATVLIVAVLSALYYFAVRLLAEKWPSVGILLGYNKAPVYLPETAAE